MKDQKNKKAEWKQKIRHEISEYFTNVIYLALFFCVFTNYQRLLLAHYQISYGEYGISLIKAAVLAKVIMIGDFIRLGRGLEKKPLIIPILFKAFWFTVWVVLLEVVESIVRGLLGGKGIFEELTGKFNYLELAWLLVIFSAFIPFFGLKELERVLGRGKIRDLFFRTRKENKQQIT